MSRIVPPQTMATRKGRDLANTLHQLIGYTGEIVKTCSLICRHATTHHYLMEVQCSVHMTEAEEKAVDAKVEQLERRISQLVEYLPETDDGPFVAEFQGDPRGVTVKIKIRGYDRHPAYDGWANEAIMVPQR